MVDSTASNYWTTGGQLPLVPYVLEPRVTLPRCHIGAVFPLRDHAMQCTDHSPHPSSFTGSDVHERELDVFPFSLFAVIYIYISGTGKLG